MTLADRMKFYKVPGVSIAVINNGKIEWAKGYGALETGEKKANPPNAFPSGINQQANRGNGDAATCSRE